MSAIWHQGRGCVALKTPLDINRILLRVDGLSHYVERCPRVEAIEGTVIKAPSLEVTLTLASLHGDWKARFAYAKNVDAMAYVFDQQARQGESKSPLFDYASWHLAYSIIKGQRIEWDQRERWLVNHLGITHLFVVSGLHVGFVAFLALTTVRGLWHASCRIRRYCGKRACLDWLVAVPCCAAYAWWSGAGEPAQRAALMAFLILTLRVLFHRQSLWSILLVSAWAMLLVWPGRLISPSFWLSFGFVGLLALTVGKLPKRATLMYLQCILSIFGLLFTLGWQQSLSTSAVVTNVVLVPFVAFFWFPFSLLALFEFNVFSTTWLYGLVDTVVMLGYQWGAPLIFALPELNITPSSSTVYKLCLLALAWLAILALPLRRAWVLLVLTVVVSISLYHEGSVNDRVWQRFNQTIVDVSANDPKRWWPLSQTQLRSLSIAVNPSYDQLAHQALQQDWDIVLLNSERQEATLLRGLGITVITLADNERLRVRQLNGQWHVESTNCYEFLNLLKTVACEHAESLESVLN